MINSGGKARSLIELSNAGYPVPEFCVVRFDWMIDHLTRSGCSGQPGARWRERILSTAPGEPLLNWLTANLPRGERFAVRSSALVEDGREDSFAGQFDSLLNVARKDIEQAIIQVWSSTFSTHALDYAARREVDPRDLKMAVVIQRMLTPQASGVAFAIDPLSGQRDTSVVAAVLGLGEGLVSGALVADRFEVARDGCINSTIATKTHRVVNGSNGGIVTELTRPAERTQAAIDDRQVLEIARLTQELSRQHGVWQDVEWCIEDGRTWLLQCRPITGLECTPDPDGEVMLWDSSNIIESYSGVTTPLTFSFVRHVYSRVYPEFLAFMGVEQDLIEDNRQIFQMVGLFQGRIYYNLLNWYRCLSLLPGYELNARFMEQMMGVAQGFEVPPAPVVSTGNPWWRLIRAGVSITRNWWGLKRRTTEFHKLVDATLAAEDLHELDLHGLLNRYRSLETTLLDRWQTPLVNDFFAMVCFGALRHLIGRWCPSLEGEFQNQLLCAERDIVSTEPIERLQELVALSRGSEALQRAAATRDPAEFLETLEAHPAVHAKFEALRSKFGARTLEELKLETVTATQDPKILAAQLLAYVNLDANQLSASGPGISNDDRTRDNATAVRREAEARLEEALSGSFIRYRMIRWLLGHTRHLVANRENLRFERTRVFDAARNLFLAMGRRLALEGVVACERDVFWLTREELIDYLLGTAVDVDLSATVSQRRSTWEQYPAANPGDRFETLGAPYIGNSFQSVDSATPVDLDEGVDLQGTGCCSGIVTAEVLVVRDPQTVVDLEGRILVAERTDPGWTPLFPLAAGILVQRGSLLSHSAIVAREMGIPAIVAIDGLLDQLRTGDVVTFDGSRGTISIQRQSSEARLA